MLHSKIGLSHSLKKHLFQRKLIRNVAFACYFAKKKEKKFPRLNSDSKDKPNKHCILYATYIQKHQCNFNKRITFDARAAFNSTFLQQPFKILKRYFLYNRIGLRHNPSSGFISCTATITSLTVQSTSATSTRVKWVRILILIRVPGVAQCSALPLRDFINSQMPPHFNLLRYFCLQ